MENDSTNQEVVNETEIQEAVEEEPTSTRKRPGMKERLMRMFTALSNCLKEPLLSSLVARNYTVERINAILAIYHEVMELDRQQDEAYKKQHNSTELLVNAFNDATAKYGEFRRLAQVALKLEPSSIRALKLNRKIDSSLAKFISLARVFYLAVSTDDALVDKLAGVNLTREEITAQIPVLEHLEALNVQQEYDKKAAQDATEKRDLRLDVLEGEYADLYTVAKIALANEKQYLEMLDLNRRN